MQKTILCTPENAAQFQRVVRAWPQLHATVLALQAQNLFPGLRAVEITLTGSEEHCAKGLGALMPENAPGGLLEVVASSRATQGEKNDAA
jgi:hypothetical protein